MTENGIGSFNWVNDYVGISYEITGRSALATDCWGLICMVYRDRLGINLPDWVTDAEIDWDGKRGTWVTIEAPANFALIRTSIGGNLPDHWGLYIAGGVLAAGAPCSYFVPLDKYLERHPESQIGLFHMDEGQLQ